jgi:hypothetical protein
MAFVRFAVAAAAITLLSAPRAAEAQTLPAPVVFTAVDGVRYARTTLYVTGVVEGEAMPREVAFGYPSLGAEVVKSCEPLILLAMTKPGQYRLSIQRDTYDFRCGLSRVAP